MLKLFASFLEAHLARLECGHAANANVPIQMENLANLPLSLYLFRSAPLCVVTASDKE